MFNHALSLVGVKTELTRSMKLSSRTVVSFRECQQQRQTRHPHLIMLLRFRHHCKLLFASCADKFLYHHCEQYPFAFALISFHFGHLLRKESYPFLSYEHGTRPGGAVLNEET